MTSKNNSIKILPIFISVIFLFGLLATTQLVYIDFTQGDVCPKLLGIPACVIILMCFLIPFIFHLLKNNLIYYIGTGIALTIASYGSLMEFMSIFSCPKTENNIPMCYLSFSIFFCLILLKMLQTRKK